ncbi:MAG: Acyl transferase [Solirubrobacterales bacterium]|nr:Acyl transferase [Solirubrobacterales bacterium]
MPRFAILFPGQGSLTADASERARQLWPELVDRAAELMGEDPFLHAHATTASAQPAIFVASMAEWRERAIPLEDVCAMAGHSLGEFTALAAAGALAVDNALRLVILRGAEMARAARRHQHGSMIALLGGDLHEAVELAARFEVVVANDNAPGQLVVSGDRGRLRDLAGTARAAGFKTLELDVTGAFHSPDMRPAVLPLLRALEIAPRFAPRVPVVSGYTARTFDDIPLELSRAVVAPVRWREVMHELVALGAEEFVDAGPGTVLARLVKRNLGAGASRGVAA